MRSKNFIIYIFIILSFGCKKEVDTKEEATPSSPKPGQLHVHLHTHIDMTEVGYGDIAADSSGRRMYLTLAQFYISGISATRTDGRVYYFPSTYILKKADQEFYLLGDIPAGNYSSISFHVGIDPAANAKDPSGYSDSNNALASQHPSMWFGQTTKGYIFINLQGMCDTSSSHTGLINTAFSYQIGSDAFLEDVTLDKKGFSVSAGQSQFLHIICDYAKLLSNVNLKTENHTDTYSSNASLTAKIAGNVPKMFRYEE